MAFSKFRAKKGIQVSTDSNPAGDDLLPVGSITMWSGTTAPVGFLLCDGSTVSRSTYPELFQVMKDQAFPYGGGDGSTTFHVPNFSGRFPRGRLSTERIGTFIGAESHVLVSANIPNHTHDVSAHTHSFTASNVGTMNTDGNHSHSIPSMTSNYDSQDHTHGLGDHGHTWYNATDCNGGSSRLRASPNPTGNYSGINAPGVSYVTGNQNANHSHNATVNTGNQSVSHTHSFATAVTSSNTDSGNTSGGAFAGTAVDHMNPFLVVNFIIKY